MTQNNNLSPLAFYTSLDEQSHRRPYAYGDVYPLYTPLTNLPPFQLVVPSGSSVGSAAIYSKSGTVVAQGIASKVSLTGFDVVVSNGAAISLSEGQYYIALAVGSTTYYSDMFTAVADISSYLKVEWWDDENLLMDGAAIVYSTGYKNVVYLNTQLGKPEYDFEEEGERRDGLFFPEKMISEKTYKFQFLADEALCDVMRFIRMSDHVRITDRYGNVYNCDTFLMTPKWEAQGNVASVEAEFQTAMVAKKIGRNYTV